MAAPVALIPSSPTLRHRIRRARLRRRREVETDGTPLLGPGVVVEVHAGDRLVLGHECVIGEGTRIEVRGGTVSIGDGAVLGDRCKVVSFAGIAVGARCLLGQGVVLTDFAPAIGDVERPAREQGLDVQPIAIGDGARIGHGACLLRGTVVEAGAEVAPHAVAGRR